jgi:hypothetical protein
MRWLSAMPTDQDIAQDWMLNDEFLHVMAGLR